MEVSAHYPGDTKFEVTARGHRVICDQPIDNEGTDKGMSPPQFLLASFQIEATAFGLDERHQAGIPRAVKAGLIHNTLLGASSIDVVVDAAALALV